MDPTNKYESVKAVFQGLQEIIKSNGTYLLNENLKIHVENLCKQFELKKDVKITFCIICDNLDNKSTLIDALLKEKISDRLRSNHQYLVKSDPSIQKTIIADENQALCTISVEKERLNLLNNSNIVLTFEKYSEFMENIQITNAYKPDVIVLVINSPKDLQKPNIESFFDSIKDEFKDENFIFVLNEGHDLDCTATNICDVCYPSNIRYLFSGHKLENREFKISASQYLNISFNDNLKFLDENYHDLLKTLEHELDINQVLDRYEQQADNYKKKINEILKTINFENLHKSIYEYNNNLNEKAPIILEKIEADKSNSINDVSKMYKNNQNGYNDKKLQLKTFLDKKCKILNGNIQKDILKLAEEISLKDCNKQMELLSKNIMLSDGLKEEDMKKKAYELFDEFIDKQYSQNDVKKNEAEQMNNKGFISSAIKVTKGIFGYAKDAFISFKNSFKDKATSIVEGAKNQIIQSIFNAEFEKFKHNLRNKMKQNEKDLFSALRNEISSYNSLNLFIENKFQMAIISTVNREIDKMGRIKEEIEEFLASSKKFSNQNCADYFTNYFPKTDFENFHQIYKTKLNDFHKSIQDDKFYILDIKIPGLAIGAVSGATAGALLTAVVPPLMPVGALVGGIFGAIFGKNRDVEIIKTKHVRISEVLQELEKLEKDISQETNKIIEKLLISMNNFVQ